jgi:uncharacterized protein YxjI
MNDLSIDANIMFYLVREGSLLPYHPKDPLWIKLEMSSRSDSPEDTLSGWMYRESDVEDFKKINKEWLEKVKSPIVSMDNKEMKHVQPEESTEPENFIRDLQVSYVSDTEISIRGGGKNAKTYEMKELGFKKVNSKSWNAFRNILNSKDYTYYVGEARGAKRERKKAYDAAQKVLVEINKKLVPFLNKTYQLQLPEKYRVYELIPEKTEVPGTYRFKFKIKKHGEVNTEGFKELSQGNLISEIENLSKQYELLLNSGAEEAEAQIYKIKDKLNAAVVIACKKGGMPRHRAEAYLNPKTDNFSLSEYTIDKEDPNQEDPNQED